MICCFYSFAHDTTSVEKEIFNKINKYRIELGKSKLTYDVSKVESCRSHCRFMVLNNKLEHVKSFSQVCANAEIIQLNYTDGRTDEEIAKDVLEIFIDSPAHKKILQAICKQKLKKGVKMAFFSLNCSFKSLGE